MIPLIAAGASADFAVSAVMAKPTASGARSIDKIDYDSLSQYLPSTYVNGSIVYGVNYVLDAAKGAVSAVLNPRDTNTTLNPSSPSSVKPTAESNVGTAVKNASNSAASGVNNSGSGSGVGATFETLVAAVGAIATNGANAFLSLANIGNKIESFEKTFTESLVDIGKIVALNQQVLVDMFGGESSHIAHLMGLDTQLGTIATALENLFQKDTTITVPVPSVNVSLPQTPIEITNDFESLIASLDGIKSQMADKALLDNLNESKLEHSVWLKSGVAIPAIDGAPASFVEIS